MESTKLFRNVRLKGQKELVSILQRPRTCYRRHRIPKETIKRIRH